MSITITDVAKAQLIEHGIGTNNQFLRIIIKGGGCAGYKYEAGFDTESQDGDAVMFEEDLVKIVSDPESTLHIDGLHIDYSSDLMKGGFKLTNKKGSGSCGCGSSFSK